MIFVKRNDTAPSLQSTLTDNGAAVNLTTASAIRVVGEQNGFILFDRIVTGNASGVVDMPWQAGDTANLGPIRVEWEVTWPSGNVQTFPASGHETVWVTKDSEGTAVSPVAGGASFNDLRAWALAESYSATSITRDGNQAIVTAVVVWPDGSAGVFTTDTASAFPGAIDAYHITYVPTIGPTRTVTQPLVTRNGAGAITAQPALVVS